MTGTTVTVGLGSCGIAAGAGKTYEKIRAMKESEKLDFILKKTSCIGMCYREPLVEIRDETGTYIYGDVNEGRAIEVIEKHMLEIGFLARPSLASSSGTAMDTSAFAIPAEGARARYCPRCGDASFVKLEGCDSCLSCSYSKCG